eukprot:GFUD01015212.1.p2 GENE.GFUD01015212.1~~GFUD01015212.1.p2  ORF type:complete len:170 (+),score=66.03 GFUD01015212.1:485-994(+)
MMMENKQENKGINLVIVHKETRWKKFKRRVISMFTRDKLVAETVVVPEIIVTNPVDNSGGGVCVQTVQAKDTTIKDVEEEKTETDPVRFKRSQKEDLARAHQDVIAQMRESMARGGPKRNTNPEVKEKVGDHVKPPVPPTKAAAVAKIRETIAQAKRDSCKDLTSGTTK